MFIISKLYWMLAQPLSLAFFLIVFGLLAAALRFRRMATTLTVGAAILLFVTLFTTTGSVLLQGLEARFPRPASEPSDLRCMIVLGGGFETEVTTARGGFEINQAGDRFIEALRLAQAHPQARILVSGGDGSLSGSYEGDAAVSGRFFTTFGIAEDRLISETQSRTTFENVVNTRILLEKQGLSRCLLVTSAFHMPRAVGLFRKLGLDVVPWPTDYRTSGRTRLGLDFTQPALNAQQTTTALREWNGLLGYYLAGRTHAFYPR